MGNYTDSETKNGVFSTSRAVESRYTMDVSIVESSLIRRIRQLLRKGYTMIIVEIAEDKVQWRMVGKPERTKPR